MFGMICLGWLADRKSIKVVHLSCICVLGEMIFETKFPYFYF